MIVILKRGDDVRVLRNITHWTSREVPGMGRVTMFQPRCMFTSEYLSTYDAIVAVGHSLGKNLHHWIKEPRYD